MIILLVGILLLVPTGFVMAQNNKIKNAKTSKEKFVRYDALFKYHANGYDWRWLKAISKQESDLGNDKSVREGKVSYDGLSYGLMQIAEGVGSANEIALKGYGGKEKLNDPNYSIGKAAKLVRYLNKKYGGDARKVFLGYNQGEKNTDRGKDYTDKYSERIFKWLDWINQQESKYDIKE